MLPRSLTANWEQANVPAILWTTHAGQETGHAVADVLFGSYNPAGRLTQTWYQSDSSLPSILNYDIIKGNATYQYFQSGRWGSWNGYWAPAAHADDGATS